MLKPININDKLNKFSDLWSPRVIAEMNDYQFKLAKVKGEFVWHSHEETDETFIVLDGELLIEFRDKKIRLNKGELYIVPKGIEHKPYAENECHIMLIEPKGIINTGEKSTKLTSKNDIWV
tara:strand:- start:131 stop:493 length:363 start_codon:yes stop_codon:yes gene_type:complete